MLFNKLKCYLILFLGSVLFYNNFTIKSNETLKKFTCKYLFLPIN